MKKYDKDKDTGYYGRIPSDEFIGYDDLCDLVSFNAGELMPEDRGWLKFYYHGDILYIPQHPIRYNISWDDINNAGLVYGRDITISGVEYEISLMTGANSDPVDLTEWVNANASRELALDICHGSMWNELIYRVHQDIPGVTDTGEECSGGPQYGENWDTLSDAYLNTYWCECDYGTVTWCRETSSDATGYRVLRGNGRLAYFNRATASYTDKDGGWRPVLKVKKVKQKENIDGE